ncbi:hypothetical protein SanaruYs_06850 [Chryseotalea sanaruensis]|uniref:Phage holin family protein n=1 Tax=Chryseotalea sanaruensis TaxID=2482724 RepID=A0A401U6K0_9BACT|nr:hypothetical protein [Chryseotalea sanaruensis]GCC50470.1 hypothetical protein SanaruYs_06850 [Chryseotalea sanaruensis]
MSKQRKSSEELVDVGTDLVAAYRDLITIKAIEYTSLGASTSVVGLLSLILGLFILLFIGFGAAWWLGEAMDNIKAGFFIVGGVYTLAFTLILLTSSKVLVPGIRNFIIKKIYEQN